MAVKTTTTQGDPSKEKKEILENLEGLSDLIVAYGYVRGDGTPTEKGEEHPEIVKVYKVVRNSLGK
jgi:hypothetical protein